MDIFYPDVSYFLYNRFIASIFFLKNTIIFVVI